MSNFEWYLEQILIVFTVGTILDTRLARSMYVSGPAISTIGVQITPNYIFTNIFSSECSISFLYIAEESSLNSAVLVNILLC